MFSFLLDKGLISANQSGSKPGDSCINQLLSITHNSYKLFDDGYEWGVFLDISIYSIKFDTMVLYSNYKEMGYLKHFWTNRKQRVELNGKSSLWTIVKAPVLYHCYLTSYPIVYPLILILLLMIPLSSYDLGT